MNEEKSIEEKIITEKPIKLRDTSKKKPELKELANRMKWSIFIMMFLGIASSTIKINPLIGAFALIIGVFFLMFWVFYILVKDERIQRICEKSFTNAFVVFAFVVGIIVVIFALLDPTQSSITTEILLFLYPILYALFSIIILFLLFYIYYQKKM